MSEKLSQDLFDMGAVEAWLTMLHGESDGWVVISSTKDWTGQAFNLDEDGIAPALAYIGRLNNGGADGKPAGGIYARCTTVASKPTDRKRGSDDDSLTLPGFWADVDIAGPGHQHEACAGGDGCPGKPEHTVKHRNPILPLPATVADAMKIVSTSGLPEPTLWVHSGGGLYPWWLLQHPEDISGRVKGASAFSAAWHQVLVHSAAKLGLHYGAGTHDMSRVLRIPGTVNRKVAEHPRPCRTMTEDSSGIMYTLAELRAGLEAAKSTFPEEAAPAAATRARSLGALGVKASTTAGEGGLRPGDDFNARADWGQLLTEKGWTYHHAMGATEYWHRPGKDRGECGATLNSDGTGRLWVFTTSTELDAMRYYTPFQFVAHYDYAGDLSACARDLARNGYGERRTGGDVKALVSTAAAVATTAVMAVTGVAASPPSPIVDGDIEATQSPAGGIPTGPRTRIQLSDEVNSVNNLIAAVARGAFPEIYHQGGRLVALREASQQVGTRMRIDPLTVDIFRLLLAWHGDLWRYKDTKDGRVETSGAVPTKDTMRTIVSNAVWPGVPYLAGIATAPFLRPDGTLVQDHGYDAKTCIFLDRQTNIERIPDKPTPEQVANARKFVFDKVFGDFRFASTADRANFFALLVSPILRPYIGGLMPLGLFTAPMPASGKTHLTDAIGYLYGHDQRPWVGEEGELRKAITATLLTSQRPIIVIDNAPEGTCVKSANLAKLLTSPNWSDRELGASRTAEITNDRLWLISGNNLTVGGDIASRSVLVHLDPRTPRPELRRDFTIGQFDEWIKDSGNRAQLLHSLLVMVMDWMAAGAPRNEQITMRSFTGWAAKTGGFLAHHGMRYFLDNVSDLARHDETSGEYAAFLNHWQKLYGDRPMTSKQLRDSASGEWMGAGFDRWEGTFLTDADGKIPSVKSVGRLLAAHADRFHGGRCIRRKMDTATKTWTWWVESFEEDPVVEPAQAIDPPPPVEHATVATPEPGALFTTADIADVAGVNGHKARGAAPPYRE